MKTIPAILILAALLASCAHVVPVTPIAPAAAHLQATVAATSASAKRVSKAVTTTHEDATKANTTIAQDSAIADRMATSGTATKAELEANAKAWHDAWLASSKTVDSSDVAVIDAKELAVASDTATTEATDLSELAVETDKNTATLVKNISDNAADTARGKAMRWTFWIAIALAVLAAIGWIFMRFTQRGAAIAARTLIP